MTNIPENAVTKEDLIAWYEMSKTLKELKVSEILLRKKIFTSAFPNPEEGSNDFKLEDGWVLKGKFGLTRTIDEGAFNALREKLQQVNVNPDSLVQFKLTLVKSKYNKLTTEEQLLFDQCLVIKPATPSLEIVLPKKAVSE